MNYQATLLGRLRRSEGLRVILPFAIFYASAMIVPQWSNSRVQNQTTVPQSEMMLQAKDPKDNGFRRVQLRNSYQCVLSSRRTLLKAQEEATLHPSQKTKHRAILSKTWDQLAREGYNIVAAETDDSVFEETHLPKSVPID